MITIKEAKAITKRYLTGLQKEIGNPVQITKIQKESFGRVFFTNPNTIWKQETLAQCLLVMHRLLFATKREQSMF